MLLLLCCFNLTTRNLSNITPNARQTQSKKEWREEDGQRVKENKQRLVHLADSFPVKESNKNNK